MKPTTTSPTPIALARTTCRRCGLRLTVAHVAAEIHHCPRCWAVLIETVAYL